MEQLGNAPEFLPNDTRKSSFFGFGSLGKETPGLVFETPERAGISRVKVFGCLCYALVHPQDHLRLEPRAQRGVFVGVDEERKGFRVVLDGARQFTVARLVTFYEHGNASQGLSDASGFPLLIHFNTTTGVSNSFQYHNGLHHMGAWLIHLVHLK